MLASNFKYSVHVAIRIDAVLSGVAGGLARPIRTGVYCVQKDWIGWKKTTRTLSHNVWRGKQSSMLSHTSADTVMKSVLAKINAVEENWEKIKILKPRLYSKCFRTPAACFGSCIFKLDYKYRRYAVTYIKIKMVEKRNSSVFFKSV